MKAPDKAEDALNVEPRSVAPRRIVLTGFMGSGKTTVGPLVAERLGWRFVDVDDVIAAEAGATIPEIFKREGETEFRRRERAAISSLARGDRLVLALGGGAIEDAATRELLLSAAETMMVHLEIELADGARALPRHGASAACSCRSVQPGHPLRAPPAALSHGACLPPCRHADSGARLRKRLCAPPLASDHEPRPSEPISSPQMRCSCPVEIQIIPQLTLLDACMLGI